MGRRLWVCEVEAEKVTFGCLTFCERDDPPERGATPVPRPDTINKMRLHTKYFLWEVINYARWR